MKKAIKDLLLKLGLLGYVGGIYTLALTLKNNASRNRKFARDHKNFPLPPMLIAFDAYGEIDWENYYSYGLQTATMIASLINECLGDRENGKIFEWGCGPGRIIRHLPTLMNRPAFAYAGSDYNQQTIDWCNRYLNGIKFIKNNMEPPLDIAEDTFDFIFCVSVFTHLSEKHHREWLEELLRVLKTGGYLMFTTHGDRFSSHLQSKDLDDYKAGKLVVWDRSKEGKRDFTAFHSPQYIREQFLAGQKITKFIESGIGQDIWIVQKQ